MAIISSASGAAELRAAMSMARLLRDLGKRDEARDLLTPVYGWFTEGFDIDLKETKTLLDELQRLTTNFETDIQEGGHQNRPQFSLYFSQSSPKKQGPVLASENLISQWSEFHSIILISSLSPTVMSQPIIVKCGTLLCNSIQAPIASLNFGMRLFSKEKPESG
jgi:hypothetical protein